MPRRKATLSDAEVVASVTPEAVKTALPDASAQLIAALVEAIKLTKPVEKKNAANYKTRTGYEPKDGSPKIKLKRKIFQHGMEVDPDRLYNEDLELLNKLKPGKFMGGHVQVIRRRDKGLDIQYPVKTAAQRLRLVNSFGIRDFRELIARCIEESNNPAQYAAPEDLE